MLTAAVGAAAVVAVVVGAEVAVGALRVTLPGTTTGDTTVAMTETTIVMTIANTDLTGVFDYCIFVTLECFLIKKKRLAV